MTPVLLNALLCTTIKTANLRPQTAAKLFSSAPPLSAFHAQLQDVENLFVKHQLDQIKDPKQFDQLAQSKIIPATMAKELKHELEVEQDAQGNFRL